MILNLKIKREVISIHVGQAGVQIGGTVWELYCFGLKSSRELNNLIIISNVFFVLSSDLSKLGTWTQARRNR